MERKCYALWGLLQRGSGGVGGVATARIEKWWLVQRLGGEEKWRWIMRTTCNGLKRREVVAG